jgi:hypothetical protein
MKDMKMFEDFFADLKSVGYSVFADDHSLGLLLDDESVLYILAPNGKDEFNVFSDSLNIDEVLSAEDLIMKLDEYRAKAFTYADNIPRGI